MQSTSINYYYLLYCYYYYDDYYYHYYSYHSEKYIIAFVSLTYLKLFIYCHTHMELTCVLDYISSSISYARVQAHSEKKIIIIIILIVNSHHQYYCCCC